MANRPIDLDNKQAFKDIFFRKNKYHLDENYLIKDGKKHPLAILVPGGGYSLVCSFIEGVPIAKKLNEKGISAVIVYYRTGKKALYPNPMDDLASGVKEILSKAEEYNLETKDYSIWGCSAGGHLAASFGCDNMGYLKYNLPKPSALILTYPVITMDPSLTHKGTHDNLLGNNPTKESEEETSVEKHIHANYPRTFVWCSKVDKTVPYQNSLLLKETLDKERIDGELKIYESVDHGVGPATGTNAEGWIDEAVKFWRKCV